MLSLIKAQPEGEDRSDSSPLILAMSRNMKLEQDSTLSNAVPLVLSEALQCVDTTLQPVGHHAQFYRTVANICSRKHTVKLSFCFNVFNDLRCPT